MKSLVVFALTLLLGGTAFADRRIQTHRFKHNDPEKGMRCLRIEVLDDDLIHFEIYERREQDQDNKCLAETDMIWVSPMVDGYNVNEAGKHYFNPDGRAPYKVVYKEGYQGPDPDQYRRNADGVETSELKVSVYNDSRCVKVFDKKRGVELADICGNRLLEKADKQLRVTKHQMKNFYGLGNLFVRSSMDGDWNGIVWDVAKKTDRPGHLRGPEFIGGPNGEPSTPSTSQFPLVYALGNGKNNYAILFDNGGRMTMDMSQANEYVYETFGDELRFFVMSGDSLPDLRRDVMQLTGKPPVPPKSMFGHWSSRFGYRSWDEARGEIKALQDKKFPLDGLALDLQWFGAKFNDRNVFRMGTLQFHEPEFGNPDKNILDFYHTHGVQLMPIEESYIDERLDEHHALASPKFRLNTPGFDKITDDQGCFLARNNLDRSDEFRFFDNNFGYDKDGWDATVLNVGDMFKTKLNDPRSTLWWGRGGNLDHSNGQARYFWHQLKRIWLADKGIFAHWLDLGEPEMFFEFAYYYGFPELYRSWKDLEGKDQQNVVQKHGDIHNFYNLFWAMGISEGYANKKNSQMLRASLKRMYEKDYDFGPRHWTMSRAGTVGSQRYGGMWSGDIGGNFESFRAHLNSQLHMSLLPMDYYSADAGGFWHTHQGRNPNDPYDRMLYKQWFATASLIDAPLRPHGWADGEDLSYGAHVRGDLLSNRANVRRRYELIPYLYSLAHRAHLYGEAMYPPLVYYYQDEEAIRVDGTEKMIGANLLMRSVAEWRGVGNPQASEAPVYLPRGTWVDYESLDWHDSNGGTTRNIPFFRRERVPPFESPDTYYFFNPLFAKAGSIIPTAYVDEKTMNALGKRWGEDERVEFGVRVFASAQKSEFTAFEDDGVSQGYLNGQVLRTKITQEENRNSLHVHLAKAEGSKFTGLEENRRNVVDAVVRGRKAARVLLNGQLQAKCDDQAIAKFDTEQRQCWYQAHNNLVRLRTQRQSVWADKQVEFQFD